MNTIAEANIASMDSHNMWSLLTGFADQWEEAVRRTESLRLDINANRIKNICLVGMGGSAIGADLIRGYSYKTCPHPIQVVRHYTVPKWVGEETLCIICSFSGNTEETLAAADQARQQGAQLVAITSGGELMVKASRLDFDYIKIPNGIPTRTALGYSFVPLFRIFQQLGLVDEDDDALQETGTYLRQQGALFTNTSDNEALSLARDLIDTLPIIYSDDTMLAPVNLRWRSQIQENAKTLAYGNTLPEMNHNEIIGWDQIVHLTGRLSVVMLRDRDDHPKVKQRMETTADLISPQLSSVNMLQSRGNSRLTRMFSLIHLGDWTSFYLAMLNGVDPTPVAKIDLLKRRLSEL